jgi:hypothetical protein
MHGMHYNTSVSFPTTRRSKPAWVILRENDDARREAARIDNRPHGLALRDAEARQTPEFARGLAAARSAADAILALPEAEVIPALKALGGWTALLTAAFETSVDGATIPGGILIESSVTGADFLAIRNAAIKAAN